MDKGKGRAHARDESTPDTPLPHPAEDLSSDDDLLSWILVDQLGGMPNSRLGVHPQENKFVGPKFKTEEVLEIVRETVVKGNLPSGMAQLQEFHLIAAHARGKRTESQRDRFIQHLRRYLLPYAPNSRVDIHTTDRYSHITLHPELAVYATRPLAPGTVLQELQGSVVELPEEWRKEMDLSDDFIEARLAAGEESEDELSDEDDDGDAASAAAASKSAAAPRGNGARGEESPSSAGKSGKGKGKEKEKELGARRSGRTRRRDFSIVWSELKRCYQLFLGPARFLNHDCAPNVELLRQGKYVTFRVTRAVRIGDELTTFYGADYFGPNNIECLCLSCELAERGPYAVKAPASAARPRSAVSRSATPGTPAKAKTFKPSKLRESILARGDDDSAAASAAADTEDLASESVAESSTAAAAIAEEEEAIAAVASDVDELDSDSDTPEPVKREKLSRAAKLNKSFIFSRKLSKASSGGSSSPLSTPHPDDDLPEDFPRCATCAAALHERMWFGGRYFDHCPRCTRHAFIFSLPWPAHKGNEVQEYPPSHLIPPNYVPVRVSTVPLPSLTKKRIMPVATADPAMDEQGMLPVTKEYRAQLRLRKEIALDEFQVESLREAAWAVHLAYEEAQDMARQQHEARLEEKRMAREAKKARDAEKIKGSGVWSRYVYVTEEELLRREQERNALTLGTRRGGRYKREDMEGTPEREMREIREAMRKSWDDEEKAVAKLRMESWRSEQSADSQVETPKRKKLGKGEITPIAKVTLKRPATASVSASRGRPPKTVKVGSAGSKWKNSKAKRLARTAAASAARRKSLPNPITQTAFGATLTAAAKKMTGAQSAAAKGKARAKAVSEGELSDDGTISGAEHLVDTSRMSKQQKEKYRSRSPVKPPAAPMAAYQSTFRVALPGKRLAPGPAALPESNRAALGVNGAYKPKTMYPGQAIIRLGPSTHPGASSKGGKTTAESDAVLSDASSESSERVRRSVSAALGAISRSRSATPPRAGGGANGNAKSVAAKVGKASGPKARASAASVGKGKARATASISPLKAGVKRKARASASAVRADSTPLSSLSATDSDSDSVADGMESRDGSFESEEDQGPPTKRPRGRPPGTGYLQKRAAAAAAQARREERARQKQEVEDKAAEKREKRRLYQRAVRAKQKAEKEALLAEANEKRKGKAHRKGKGKERAQNLAIEAREDESFTVATAATLVSDNVQADMSHEDVGYFSDNSAVLAKPGNGSNRLARNGSRVSAASAMTSDSEGDHIDQEAIMENPRDSLSRTPSPFMRRPRSTDSNRLSDMEGEGVQGVGSFDPDYQVGFEDTVDTEGTRPPSPLLGPNSGRDAGSSSLRMEHYAPDAPGANAKGWIVEGRRARQVAEPIEYRPVYRRVNVNYGSHRRLIEETLPDITLKPDHRTPQPKHARQGASSDSQGQGQARPSGSSLVAAVAPASASGSGSKSASSTGTHHVRDRPSEYLTSRWVAPAQANAGTSAGRGRQEGAPGAPRTKTSWPYRFSH